MSIYKSRKGVRFEAELKDGQWLVFREGGGFESVWTPEKFAAEFTPAPGVPPYRMASVSADWFKDGECFLCYSDGTLWNGWGQPMFTRQQAIKVAAAMPHDLRWDGDVLCYFGTSDGDDDQSERWIPAAIQVYGANVMTYQIGDGWCWDRCIPIPTVAESIELAQQQIESDMAAGLLPRTCASFVDLHNHRDANEYGDFCDDNVADALILFYGGRDKDGGMPDGMLGHINYTQGEIDRWLKARAAVASVQTNKEYVECGGSKCPKCGSTEIESGPLEADGPMAWADVTCNDCGFEYKDQFSLTGFSH